MRPKNKPANAFSQYVCLAFSPNGVSARWGKDRAFLWKMQQKENLLNLLKNNFFVAILKISCFFAERKKPTLSKK